MSTICNITGLTGTEARVCMDIIGRQKKGFKKYGTTVENNPLPLRDWLQHAYEECLDQAIYLRRSMDEIDNNQNGSPELKEAVELLRASESPFYKACELLGKLVK